jgi:hypothetical protein
MKLATTVLTIAFIGCSSNDVIDDNKAFDASPIAIVYHDAGPGTSAADSGIACTHACDCFDDNACTLDECNNGVCQYVEHNGYCGSTIGVCRGASCCTAESTCFKAYDNDSECVDD